MDPLTIILNFLLGAAKTLLPFLFAEQVGKSRVEKKDLTETVREGKVRNEIENQSADDSRADIVKRLRDLEGQ